MSGLEFRSSKEEQEFILIKHHMEQTIHLSIL